MMNRLSTWNPPPACWRTGRTRRRGFVSSRSRTCSLYISMYVALILTSCSRDLLCKYVMDRWMMPSPLSLDGPSGPVIVCVLPDPVCPNANAVHENPSRAQSTNFLTPHCSKNSCWVVCGSKSESKEKLLRPLPGAVSISRLFASLRQVTANASFLLASAFGLTRTTTRIPSAAEEPCVVCPTPVFVGS